MAVTLTTPNTLLGALQPKAAAAKLLTTLATIVLGSVLLYVSAQIKVPTWPVPVTLQTFAVAALAAAFGARVGVATVALYLVEGLSGLPVFANGGGFQYIMSPTFGFLVGYLPMAYIIGRAADLGASRKLGVLFAAMVAGDAVVFALGFLWLLIGANMAAGAGAPPAWLDANDLLGSAFSKTVTPFVVWDLLKMAFAALTVTGAWAAWGKKA